MSTVLVIPSFAVFCRKCDSTITVTHHEEAAQSIADEHERTHKEEN